MDSGNSGSVQSSSGDEEYDSRPESLPAFLNSSGPFGASFLPHHQQQPTIFFDPSVNLFDAFSQSPQNPMNLNSSLLNLDVVRSRGLRSDPSCTDLGGNPAASSSSASPSASQAILGAQGSGHQGPPSSMQLGSTADHNGGRSSSPADQTNAVTRNPKKRTRASRRAPTTVLTTDTSNFRAMVQEFTGIPAPPFSGSPFSRRLDLFGTVGSGLRSGHLEPMGSLYPLRPSALKVHQQSPFLSSSSFLNNSLVDATNIASNNSTNNKNTNNTTSLSSTTSTFNPSSVNYQLPSDLGLPKQPQNLINMQNQMLPFHSILQPTPLHPSLNISGLGAKSQASLSLPSLDELGMGHGHVNTNLGGLLSQATTEGVRLSHQGSQDNLRTFDGNYDNVQRVNSCKLNYSASASSDFNHDKVLENVSSRATEGTVDSWIPSEFRIGE